VSRNNRLRQSSDTVGLRLYDSCRASLLDKLATRYAGEAAAEINRMVALSTGIFEVPAISLTVPVTLDAPFRFKLKTEDQLAGLEVLSLRVRRLVPGAMGRPVASRDALRRTNELVDRHCGRLRHDLFERISGYRRDLERQLQDGTTGIEQVLLRVVERSGEAHRNGTHRLEEVRKRLSERRRRLLDAGRSLDSVGEAMSELPRMAS
jgi:hypothetical protein